MNCRNGYRERTWTRGRAGNIDLAIPKLRSGSYFPDWLLEQRRRSERALVAVVAECYVRGAAAPTLRCAAVPADPAPAPGLPSPAPPMTGSGARPPRRG